MDFKAGGFWSGGVTAFFYVRVTHVNSKCNQGKTTTAIFKEQEKEKKRKYQQRVLDVEMGSFTPLVFGTSGGMGADCNCFLKRLLEKISEKNEESYYITVTWIRTLLSFEILRPVQSNLFNTDTKETETSVRFTEVSVLCMNVRFLAFLVPNELSVIERCPYYRDFRKEKLDCTHMRKRFQDTLSQNSTRGSH